MTASGWNDDVAATLGIPMSVLPALVPTSGVVTEATALPGAPAIAALSGDQQASLIGQGCVAPGSAKITFGTGGMLDVCTGPEAPASARRLDHGRSRSSPVRTAAATACTSSGAWRRSCCPPARTSSGSATTSA